MTEKEKMNKNILYDANNDEELLLDRLNAKNLCFSYNNTMPSDIKKQKDIIKKLFGKIGENFFITSPFFCDYGYNIEIGDNFYSNHNLIILDAGKVKIGNNCFIGPNVGIYTSGHPIDFDRRNKGLEYAYPNNIGNNVWIGGNTIILPGINIEDNSVIGAGSVVTKDIPSNVVAFGNPAKIFRKITSEDKNTIFDFNLNKK